MKLLPNIPTFFASMFTWNGNTGSAEMSDFGGMLDGRLYEDAVDTGFFIFSSKSVSKKLFIFQRHTYQADELQSSIFVSYDNLFTIEVFND